MCNNFLTFVNSFDYNDWGTSFNRFVMEKKVMNHIVKTVERKKAGKQFTFNSIRNILKLYGPMNYKEYDEVMKLLDVMSNPNWISDTEVTKYNNK